MAGRSAPSGKSTRRRTTRLPWRALGLGSSTIGGVASVYYWHPLVGLVIVSCETAIATITFAAALFGSEITSERAFRLLRWVANRPEPEAPPAQVLRLVQAVRALARNVQPTPLQADDEHADDENGRSHEDQQDSQRTA